MRLIKNHINILHPDAMFMCSSTNEDDTEGDINNLAKRLSIEVF